jgi:malate dehydrogenase (oxaloacetate-decarboxylating)
MILLDSRGTLHRDRKDLQEREPDKWEFCLKTNPEVIKGGPEKAIDGADALIALSRPGPGVVKPEWVSTMRNDAIVFACANPIPEIWPWEAKEAGARVIATGRSDFPNQVNNSLGFPGIFRGTLDVRATTITDEMCIAAAKELAACAEDKGIHEEYLLPTMEDWEVYPREAVAVGMTAMEQNIAQLKMTRDQLFEISSDIIKRAREETKSMMKSGFIRMPE